MFSRKRHWISWTRFRPDPARPDLDLGAQFAYPIPRPTSFRPDLTLESAGAPCWALSYRVPAFWKVNNCRLVKAIHGG